MRGSALFHDLRADVVFSVRALRRRPLFVAVAVLSLALGIGINTGLFSVARATWFRPVPGVHDPDRVVELLLTHNGVEQQEWAYPDIRDVAEAETPLDAVAAWKEREATLMTARGSQTIEAMYVSPAYFDVLGVVPLLGRPFLTSEDAGAGQHPVTVLSYGTWQTLFDGDPDIVGRAITLNQTSYTVVGVTPRAFKGHRTLTTAPDLWLPVAQHPYMATDGGMADDRRAQWALVLARLRPGATVDAATAALRTVFARLDAEYPESNEGRSARAYAFGPVPAYGRAGSTVALGLLATLTGLVLLIICGNVTGMMLARNATRSQEIAVRMALGSGRRRLVRHLLVEALTLALMAGVLGTLAAFWGTRFAAGAMNTDFPVPPGSYRPDAIVLAFTLALAVATTLAIGLLPAVRFSRPELLSSLKEDAGGGSRRVGRVHRWAASAQAGLAVFLLVISVLFVRAIGTMGRKDLGFTPQHLLVSHLDLSSAGYSSLAEAAPVLTRIEQTVRALPGVTSVSFADGLPLDLVGNFTSVSRADRPEEAEGHVRVEFTRAGEGYFEGIGTSILRGRGFERSDDAGSDRVAVVTQGLARQLWPGEDPLGRRLRIPMSRDRHEDYSVVGVVPDVASSRATENWPNVFVALRQEFTPSVMLVVRGTTEASALIRPIRSAILDADSHIAFPVVVPSTSLVARSMEGQRSGSRVAGGLGVLALLLSAIGVYGVVAFAVASRTREIGLRMAMGASPGRVSREVLSDALRVALPGLAVGLLLAVGASMSMRAMLVGVSPADPVAFGGVVGAVLVVVLLASLGPARRASGTQPMRALRQN